MRTVEIQGRKFSVRALKRGEIKHLREDHGIILMALTRNNAEEAQDRIFNMIFNPEDLKAIDELEWQKSQELWDAILKETYGAEDEEKNLSGSGPGTQTKDESDTASIA